MDSTELLLSRARSVMFAALRAGVTREQLLEGLAAAERAVERELVAAEPDVGRLRLAPAAD